MELVEALKEGAIFLPFEPHCDGAARKSPSTHILGMIALQKLSRVEYSNISNALCSKGLQKIAGGRRKIVKCQFLRIEPLSHQQTKTTTDILVCSRGILLLMVFTAGTEYFFLHEVELKSFSDAKPLAF